MHDPVEIMANWPNDKRLNAKTLAIINKWYRTQHVSIGNMPSKYIIIGFGGYKDGCGLVTSALKNHLTKIDKYGDHYKLSKDHSWQGDSAIHLYAVDVDTLKDKLNIDLYDTIEDTSTPVETKTNKSFFESL